MRAGHRFGRFLVMLVSLAIGFAPRCVGRTARSLGVQAQAMKHAERAISPTANHDDVYAEGDADGDGVVDSADRCPLDPGNEGRACPEAWSYFFLRVLNQAHLPVAAQLAFQPHVHKVVAVEDGYAGAMRPGRYVVTVSAPDYVERRIEFHTAAEETAFIEIHIGTEANRLLASSIPNPMLVASKPSALRLIFPADGALLESFRFVWQAQTDATAYRFEIAKDASFASVVYALDVTTPVLFRPVHVLPMGELFWRVTALGANGLVGSSSAPARIMVRPLVLP